MEIKYFIGIDFGHGETSVSRIPGYNSEEPLSQVPLRRSSKFEDKKVMSAICKYDKWQLLLSPSDTAAPTVVQGFKSYISNLKEEKNKNGDNRYDSLKIFGKLIFQAILDNDSELRYDPATGESNFVICIACPSKWHKIDPHIPQKYLEFFRNECGIKPATLCINESDAAFFTKYAGNTGKYLPSDSVFVIDLGSSTIDYTTYCNGKCLPEGCDGAALGAHIIEDNIVALGLAQNKTSLAEVSKLREAKGFQNKITHALSLLTRMAKENYFTNYIPAAPKPFLFKVPFPSLISLDEDDERNLEDAFRLKLSADEFKEKVIAEYAQQLDMSIGKQAKRLKDNKVPTPKYVILSGGASRMWFVEEIVKKHFPNSTVERDNAPEWIVSNGAAKYMKAHYTALQDLLQRVGNIDFEDIYKYADIEATRQATVDLLPTVIADVTGSTDYSALDMGVKFCEFFYNLDGANDHYCDIFIATAQNILNEKISNEINSVIRNIFNLSVDLSDIKIETDFAIFNWSAQFWSPRGKGASIVFDTLMEAGKNLVVFSFDIEKERNKSERVSLANACKDAFSKSNPFGVLLDPEDLQAAAEKLKETTLKEAERIFYEKELFRTSYNK